MNATTFTDLPQDIVHICASYVPPPELDYMASYQPPAGADATVTEIFRLFRASYASPDTWDWQHGIDLHREKERRGTGRAAIEKYYRELNTHFCSAARHHVRFVFEEYILPPAQAPLLSSEQERRIIVSIHEGNPFRMNALIQGVMIGTELRNRHFGERVYYGRLGIATFVQVLNPVYSMSHKAYVPSQGFYGKQFSRFLPDNNNDFSRMPVQATSKTYAQLLRAKSVEIFQHFWGQGYQQVYTQHRCVQNLGTLDYHLNRVIDLFYFPYKDTSFDAPVDITDNLKHFRLHFRNVVFPLDNASVKKVLFKQLRKILELPPSANARSLATVFKEELVRRKLISEQEMHKKYLLHAGPFDEQATLDLLDDFLGHLHSLQNNQSQSGGSAGAPAVASIDEDENTKGYLAILQRLFKEGLLVEGRDQVIHHGYFPKATLSAPVLFEVLQKILEAPSCQAVCTVFMFVYDTIRWFNAPIDDSNTKLDAAWLLDRRVIKNKMLISLISELAGKEVAQNGNPQK